MSEIDVDELIELPGGIEAVKAQEEVEFTPEEESKFVELMQVGKKLKEIDIYGHQALISTLTNEEEIALGFALAKYQDIPTISRAYKACVVAASIREIDNKAVYVPLSNESEPAELIKAKLRIVNKYSAVVMDRLYEEVFKLNNDVVELWEKMGKDLS